MLKTAITVKVDNNGEPKIIPCAGRLSQRYNYLSHTLVIEDTEKSGYIYDFILSDDLEERMIFNSAGDMELLLPYLFRKNAQFNAPVRVEKTDKEGVYMITCILAATPGIWFSDAAMHEIFPKEIMDYTSQIRNFISESNKGSSTLRNVLVKKCLADKKDIYSFALHAYDNLLDIPSEMIPLISSNPDEASLYKNMKNISREDADLMVGLYELTYGLFSNEAWASDLFVKDNRKIKQAYGSDEQTLYSHKCCFDFINKVVRKNPLEYAKLNEGLKIVSNYLLSEAED